MKDIIREGNKKLENKALFVTIPLKLKDIKLIREMNDFLKNSQDEEIRSKYKLRSGVGLAAPQLGIPKRICAIYLVFPDKTIEYNLVNPIITKKSTELIYLENGEGCLSVDRETTGITPRYRAITVSGFNYNLSTNLLEEIEIEFSEYVSIVVQHELDHLDGILFTKKMFKTIPNARASEMI
jgi:peptide deformylase